VSHSDLRAFINDLEALGQLKRVTVEVDPVLEIAEIADRTCKMPAVGDSPPPPTDPVHGRYGGCALLFENVKGADMPVVINVYGSYERMRLALGVSSFEALAERMEQLLKPDMPTSLIDKVKMLPQLAKLASFAPKVVKHGMCQDVVHTDDADLTSLPIIQCWPHDSESGYGLKQKDETHGTGRYITFAGGYTKDPDSGVLLAGFLNDGGIDLVPCKTIPLEVPANAEIVIEGWADAEQMLIEGPFGDHTGFYSLADRYPAFHVTAVTHRENPIYPTTIVGFPPQEDYYLGKATERIFLPLLKTIIPDIIDYSLPMFGAFHNCTFVKIRKEYPMQARKVISSIGGAGQMMFSKMIVVVDEHVNVHDEQDVLFHMCANVDWRRDTVIIDGPCDILDHATPYCGSGAKIGIDATRKIPGEGVVRDWPEELRMSSEIKQLVDSRCKDVFDADWVCQYHVRRLYAVGRTSPCQSECGVFVTYSCALP
jgi:4-hydroxy-3-polyprenylbenzoate decarboxylase